MTNFHLKMPDGLNFFMVFIDFHIIYDPKRAKNGERRSKMIEKNDQIWLKYH